MILPSAHQRILIVIALHFCLKPVATKSIAADADTSEIINSKEYAIAESGSTKLNGSVEELHPIPQDCIIVKSEEGNYSFRSSGNSNIICGLYLIARPDYYIELEFLHFDISCSKNGLLSVIDGWELRGQFFPGVEDHPIPRHARYHEFCGHTKPRKIFRMSQNVGTIEYRIPNADQGFVVRVKFVENPKPCNAVIQEGWMGIHTIRNFGRRINCTVSIILEETFQILSMNIGQSYRPLGNLISLRNYVVETGIIKKVSLEWPPPNNMSPRWQCKKRGYKDYVELRGGNGLDPNMMSVAEDMCGVRSFSFKKRFTLNCPHTAVRLVSSGDYDNLIEFSYKTPQLEDISNPAPSLVCSSHMFKPSEH